MGGIEERLRILGERVKNNSSAMLTEAAVKTAVVLPFFSALGYDVFDPAEVIPEFTADAAGKKGEKVDYAVAINGAIRILVECKPISMKLEQAHLAQLYRYFSVTSAEFAILTNGRTFSFYTDLDEPNKLDKLPFLTFELSDLQPQLTTELKKFAKDEFNVDGILASATRLKVTSTLKQAINTLFDDPPIELVRSLASGLYVGNFTAAVREQFTPLVKSAFRDLIRDSVQTRLSSALADNAAVEEALDTGVDPAEAEQIITTAEETEGFLIVKSIVRDVIKHSRVIMRDQKSYCGILVDNNNRRPLARLHFNRSIRYLGLFDTEKEERVRIETLDNIYDFAERLRITARRYAVPSAPSEASPPGEQPPPAPYLQ